MILSSAPERLELIALLISEANPETIRYLSGYSGLYSRLGDSLKGQAILDALEKPSGSQRKKFLAENGFKLRSMGIIEVNSCRLLF